MSIFVDESTKVIVQGLTGGQGRFHGLRNKAYGTNVVAGVTPGKGGQDVEGIPVFNSVAEAVDATGAKDLIDAHRAHIHRVQFRPADQIRVKLEGAGAVFGVQLVPTAVARQAARQKPSRRRTLGSR